MQSLSEAAMMAAVVEAGPLDVSMFLAADFHGWDWAQVYRWPPTRHLQVRRL